MRIGRLEVNPTITKDNGSTVSVSGAFVTDDPTVAKAFATRFPHLVNPDEPFLPVLFDENPEHLSGFYVPLSADVDLGPDSIDNGYIDWSAELRPVADRHGPRFESVLDPVFRTEATTMVAADADAWHAVPLTAWPVYDDGSGQDLVPDQSWNTATGPILYGADTTNTPPFRRTTTWRCAPEDWYNGAATFEQAWGSESLPVIGRVAPVVLGGPGFAISNGIIRLSGGGGSTFTIECFDPVNEVWESLTDIIFRVYASPALPNEDVLPIQVSIMRNNPCEVRIKIIGSVGTFAPPSQIDLCLRRGSSIIEMHWSIPNSLVGLGYPSELLFSPDPGSWTSATAGRFSAADANGHILVVMTPGGSAAYPNTTSTTLRAAFGWAIAGAPTNYLALRNNYYAPSAELVRVAGT
jgi:hypothetical protein